MPLPSASFSSMKNGAFVYMRANSVAHWSEWTISLMKASTSAMSEPGRMGSQMSALEAVQVKRGSTQMTFAPRSCARLTVSQS